MMFYTIPEEKNQKSRPTLYEKEYSPRHKKLFFSALLLALATLAAGVSACSSKSTFNVAAASGLPAVLPGIRDAATLRKIGSAMTPKEMAGQVMIVSLRWDKAGRPIRSLGPEQKTFLRRVQPGGVILYAQNFSTVDQVRSLIAQIFAECSVAPFIAVDEEGGRVSRLSSGLGSAVVRVPPAEMLAAAGPGAVLRAYEIMGRELRALGVNMDLAPVADLLYPDAPDVVGDRSFGDKPASVAFLVRLGIEGLTREQVLPVLKHFPGHGRSSGDSHFGTQVINASWDELYSSDLLPFRAAIAGGLPGILSAHIIFPKADPSGLPVSMSPDMLQTRLRKQLGYDGLIVTDALDMKGILKSADALDAALDCIKAGADLLLEPENPEAVAEALSVQMTVNPALKQLVRAANERIIAAKNAFGILGQGVPNPNSPGWTEKDRARGAQALSEALTGSKSFAFYR